MAISVLYTQHIQISSQNILYPILTVDRVKTLIFKTKQNADIRDCAQSVSLRLISATDSFPAHRSCITHQYVDPQACIFVLSEIFVLGSL